MTNNTIYNIYQPNIMIRAYVLAGLTVTKNVGYYTGVTAKSYLTGVYDTAGFTADKAEVTYNYLYTAPVSDTNFWSAKHTGSYTRKQPDGRRRGSSVLFDGCGEGVFPGRRFGGEDGCGSDLRHEGVVQGGVIPACRNEKLRPAKMQAGVFFR